MKKILALIIVVIAGYSIANAQSDCKVKLKSINKLYKGACENNLAHGQGKAIGEHDSYIGGFKKGYPHGLGAYTWGNGNTYNGIFVKGRMNGKGTLKIVKPSGEIEVQKGYFNKNKYIGIHETPYKVISQLGIRKIDFQEVAESTNDIKIKIFSNGRLINPPVTVLDFNNTYVENRNGVTILKNVQFPLKHIDISFSNGAFSYRAVFDIYKKGSREVIIEL